MAKHKFSVKLDLPKFDDNYRSYIKVDLKDLIKAFKDSKGYIYKSVTDHKNLMGEENNKYDKTGVKTEFVAQHKTKIDNGIFEGLVRDEFFLESQDGKLWYFSSKRGRDRAIKFLQDKNVEYEEVK